MDNWLVDVAFRDLGTNFLLPDVIDTLLEFDFNHADLKFVERNSFNVKAIPGTWARLSKELEILIESSDNKNRFHTAFILRQRLIHALIRSWTLAHSAEEAKEIWDKINSEYDKSTVYLDAYGKATVKRVTFEIADGECHGTLRIPSFLDINKLNVLIVLPGMDMTKEYFPTLGGAHTDLRDFAILSIDPPGHGYSFLSGAKLNQVNIDELMNVVIAWIRDNSNHDFSVSRIGVLGIGTSSTYAFRAGMQQESLAVVAGFEGGFLFNVQSTLGEQSSMRLKKLAKMMKCDKDEVLKNLHNLSLDQQKTNLRIPTIFTVGEYDSLFPKNQTQDFLDRLDSHYSFNFFEGEGHVLGKVINESLMLTLDQIEECLKGNVANLGGMQVIERKS